jgi:hypothetical protein
MKRILLALLVSLSIGCASTAAPDDRQLAQCPVCAYYNDLGCIDVRVDARTPCCDWSGTHYCFCSDRCKKRFEKEPTKFAR